jgi:hypothetical protein
VPGDRLCDLTDADHRWRSYRAAMDRPTGITTKEGKEAGTYLVKTLTPLAVDKIYSKLRLGKKGQEISGSRRSASAAFGCKPYQQRRLPQERSRRLDRGAPGHPWRGSIGSVASERCGGFAATCGPSGRLAHSPRSNSHNRRPGKGLRQPTIAVGSPVS